MEDHISFKLAINIIRVIRDKVKKVELIFLDHPIKQCGIPKNIQKLNPTIIFKDQQQLW